MTNRIDDHSALMLQVTVSLEEFLLRRYRGDQLRELRERIRTRFVLWLVQGLRYADADRYVDDDDLGRKVTAMFRRSEIVRVLGSDTGATIPYLRGKVRSALVDSDRFRLVDVRFGKSRYFAVDVEPRADARSCLEFIDCAEVDIPLRLHRREQRSGETYEWWSEGDDVERFVEALFRFVGAPLTATEIVSTLADCVRYEGEFARFDGQQPSEGRPIEAESFSFPSPDANLIIVTANMRAAVEKLLSSVTDKVWEVARRRQAGEQYKAIAAQLGGRVSAMKMRQGTFKERLKAEVVTAGVDPVSDQAIWILEEFIARKAGRRSQSEA